MAIPHAASNQVVSVGPLGPDLATTKSWTDIKTEQMQLIRLVVLAGKEIPAHDAPGEITIQCVEGRVEFTASGKTQELGPGQLIYLSARETHALRGIEDASLLVTILSGQG
jgi:quercetin dioxygenase-like cupin family protein